MARPRGSSGAATAAALKLFMQLPTPAKIGVGAVLLVGVVALFALQSRPAASPQPEQQPPGTSGGVPTGTWTLPASGEVTFMFWNVENLFDDQDDKRNSIDDPYDNWFATDAATRQLKYDRLTEIILKPFGGRGPDVLVCVEVESVRAATLLKDALNAKLPAEAIPYAFVGMKDLDAGRHIAPAVIARVPIDAARTTLHGNDLRILEVHLVAEKRELCIIASHWTSQLTQKDGSRGEKGLVTVLLDKELLRLKASGERAELYACGPDGMLRAVGERAVAAGCRGWLSLDKHMVCGVGACLACVQKLRREDGSEWIGRVCHDGPVFEAREIVW